MSPINKIILKDAVRSGRDFLLLVGIGVVIYLCLVGCSSKPLGCKTKIYGNDKHNTYETECVK